MESHWEDITPGMAREYLHGHAAGRPLNKGTVSMYARDMAAGHWRPTHQGVAFDEDGVLFDGQHRMTAVIQSRTTVRFWVTRNASRSSFGTVDTGRTRSMADRLQLEGMKDATQLAAIGRRVAIWESGKPWTRRFQPTREEIAKKIEDHPELIDAAAFAHVWPGRRTLTPGVAGFCWWLFRALDEDGTSSFLGGLRTGEDLEPGSPVLALRERLLGERTGRDTAAYAAGYQRQEIPLALTIIAWNHYRKGSKVSRLQLPSTMSDETFPRPV